MKNCKKKPNFFTLEERDRLIWARKTQRKREKAVFLGKLKEPIVQWLRLINGSWTLGIEWMFFLEKKDDVFIGREWCEIKRRERGERRWSASQIYCAMLFLSLSV